jgi:hypothetical protein
MNRFFAEEPMSLSRLAAFTRSEYAISINPDTLRHMLQQDERLKPCEGKSMEMQRVHVPTDNILGYCAAPKHVADIIPTTLVWNMEEIGHSDWVDADSEGVYVPTEFDPDFIPIRVNRGGKPIALAGCICPDGTFVTQ